MRTPRPEIIERLREDFPVGCRVELIRMDDVRCGLGVAYGEDVCRRID